MDGAKKEKPGAATAEAGGKGSADEMAGSGLPPEKPGDNRGMADPGGRGSVAVAAKARRSAGDPAVASRVQEDVRATARGTDGDPPGSPDGGPGPASRPTLWQCPDGSFVKRIVTPGRGLDKPKGGSRCRVAVAAMPGWPGTAGESVDLTLGAGRWRGEPWGELMEKCLESMRRGEEAELLLPGDPRPPPRLTLTAFTPGRDSWELHPGEKEALAQEERALGTELFRAGDVRGAARCYGRALRLLLTLAPPGPPERAALHANLAACQLHLGQPRLAQRSCERALEREPGHLKALYRRGVARAALGELGEAAADLRRVLEAEPANRAAREALANVVAKGRERDAELARGLRKMFT
ncbi:FK506-binding protein-like [Tachyglossus aculeatus]|uniref:FK506-binding protein-like n=1 Tax=Tachyglossus aculeatus TaxID=9261 RepID=UPI0018F38EAA|nr:FK506-binding protein-like [Tachyglossus aculeatus]